MNQRGFAIPSPTLIMAGVIIALSLSNVILFNLYSGAKDELSDYKSSVATQMEVVRIENEKRVTAMESVAKEAADEWDRARADLSRSNRIRVQANSCEGKMSTVPAGPSKPDAAATQQGLDPAIILTVQQCEERIENAVTDAAQLVWLQQWIKDTHEASK